MGFSEFNTVNPEMSFNDVWLQYITYGGLPYCALLPSDEEKGKFCVYNEKEDVPPWGGAHPLGRRGDSKCPCTPLIKRL